MSYDFRAKNEFDDKLLMEFLDYTKIKSVSIYSNYMSATVTDPIVKYHNGIEFIGNHADISFTTEGFNIINIERIKDYYALTFVNDSYNHCMIRFECDREFVKEFFDDFDAELNAL